MPQNLPHLGQAQRHAHLIMKHFAKLAISSTIGLLWSRERIHYSFLKLIYHVAHGGPSTLRTKARDLYLNQASSWRETARELDQARFKLWQARTGFPQSGWSHQFPPLHPHSINIALGAPLPWHSDQEADVADIRYLLSLKAVQLAGSELSSIGASHVMDMMDKISAQGHATYFRDRLGELDPEWHRRGIPDNEAGHYLRKDQDLIEQLQTQRARQDALTERATLGADFESNVDAFDKPNRHHRL